MIIPPDLMLKLEILINVYFLLLTLYNIRYLRRNSAQPLFEPHSGWRPRVSVILPLRNEEARVRKCVDSLLAQSYDNFELIAVDDNSEDGTKRILNKLARRDDRLKIVSGRPLPPGWNGKSFACSQGVEVAEGDYLVFTDADTVHGPDSISWALHVIREHNADFVSAYVRQRLGNLGELVVVPVMFIMTALFLPLGLIPRKNSSLISFAIGQFMICRSDSFRAIDRYERFKGSVVEDVSMAREMKRAGFKTIFLDAQGHVSCRMYNNFGSAFRGIAKSLFGAINSSVIAMAALMALIVLAVVYPFFAAMSGVLGGAPLFSPATIPVGLFLLTWSAKMHNRHISIIAVILYPLTFFCLILLAVYSAVKTGFGNGLDWKGRLVTAQASSGPRRSGSPYIVNFSLLYQVVASVTYAVTLLVVFLFTTLVFGLRVDGRENLARRKGRRCILVSNHVLYLDSAVVGCAIFPHRTFFTALEETFSMPVVGRYIRLLGAFPLPAHNTFRQILGPMQQMFSMNRFVHVFPEGELRRMNREPAEFKTGAFFLACILDALVVPVTLVLLERPLVGRFIPDAFRVKVVVQEPLDSRDYLLRYTTRQAAIRAMARDARERMNRVVRAEGPERIAVGNRTMRGGGPGSIPN